MQKNTGLVFNCYNVRRKLVRSARVKKVNTRVILTTKCQELLLTTQSHWYIKVKSEAAVYMAAVLEYIVAEVVDLSNVGG